MAPAGRPLGRFGLLNVLTSKSTYFVGYDFKLSSNLQRMKPSVCKVILTFSVACELGEGQKTELAGKNRTLSMYEPSE